MMGYGHDVQVLTHLMHLGLEEALLMLSISHRLREIRLPYIDMEIMEIIQEQFRQMARLFQELPLGMYLEKNGQYRYR